MLVFLVLEGCLLQAHTRPDTSVSQLKQLIYSESHKRLPQHHQGLSPGDQILLTAEGKVVAAKAVCAQYDVGLNDISIYVYNRRALRDARLLDDAVELSLPAPITELSSTLDPLAVQAWRRPLEANLKYYDIVPRNLLSDIKRQIAGVTAASRNLHIHRQRLEEEFGKFRTTAEAFLKTQREFELIAPTLRSVLQQVMVDPDLLAPRRGSAVLRPPEEDEGSPTPLAREVVPLIDVLCLPFCRTVADFDALVDQAVQQRQVVKQRLDSFETGIKAIKQRDSRAEDSLAEYHDKRRALREQLDQVLEEQTRQLKTMDDLAHNVSATAGELRQRDVKLRELCGRVADLKRRCIADIHRALVGIMSAQQLLRDTATQHSSTEYMAELKSFSKTLKCLRRIERAPYSLLQVMREIHRRQRFRHKYSSLMERCKAVLVEVRRQEIAARARFAQHNRSYLPNWTVLATMNDYPPSCLVQPREFDTELPDVSPSHLQRISQGLDIAARDTPFQAVLEKWASQAAPSNGEGEADGANTVAALQQDVEKAAGDLFAGNTRQANVAAQQQQQQQVAETISSLQRQLLILHTECYLWQQMALKTHPSLGDADLSALSDLNLPLPGLDAALKTASRLSDPSVERAGDAAGAVATERNPASSELEARCRMLQAQLEQMQQALVSRNQVVDDLQMELAASRMATSVTHRDSPTFSEDDPSSEEHKRSVLSSSTGGGGSGASSVAPTSPALAPKITIQNWRVGDYAYFVKTKRGGKPRYKAIRFAGQAPLVIPSERCQQRGLLDGPQTTVVGKIVALTPKIRRGAGDVPDEPYFECDIEPVEGGRGGE